jgi:hypothetical protein
MLLRAQSVGIGICRKRDVDHCAEPGSASAHKLTFRALNDLAIFVGRISCIYRIQSYTLRCGACSKRTGKPCQGAAMPNGRCKLHGGKSHGIAFLETPSKNSCRINAAVSSIPVRSAHGNSLVVIAICALYERFTRLRRTLFGLVRFPATSVPL